MKNQNLLLLSMPGGLEWLFVLLIIILFFVFWIRTILEIARNKYRGENTKTIWLLVVIIFGVVGALIYNLLGRKDRITAVK